MDNGVTKPPKRVTLADVARRAGLSSTAASMVLTGRPDTRLSAEAHARVHAAALELGYRPNTAARALRTDKSHSIAFISDHIATTRFASGLIRGALAAADAAGHVLFVMETRGEVARELAAIEAALDRQVDGLIIAAMRAREIFLTEAPIPQPVVILNGTNSRFPDSVLPDEYEGGRAAVRLLTAGVPGDIVLLGHNPADEAGLFRSEPISRRFAGIRDEMAARDLEFTLELSAWDWEPDRGYDLTRKALTRCRPTAILCLNDRLAFGAYQALGEAGLRVPTDVAIVSFDDDDLAGYLRPGLTTIGLPHEEMGKRAVETLLGKRPGGPDLVPMREVLRGSHRKVG